MYWAKEGTGRRDRDGVRVCENINNNNKQQQRFHTTSTSTQETPWEEALRSQMPRFGRSGTVRFRPTLPAATADGAPRSANEEEDEKLAM